MKKNLPEQYRAPHSSLNAIQAQLYSSVAGDNFGLFYIPRKPQQPHVPPRGIFFLVLFTAGEGWEHASISIPSEKRCPTWEEMCYIKDIFWEKDEACVQYHPAEKDYISQHPYCLHIWRPTQQTIPTPPPILVGVNKK